MVQLAKVRHGCRRPMAADLGDPGVDVEASVVRHPKDLPAVRAEETADLFPGRSWLLRQSAHHHRQ